MATTTQRLVAALRASARSRDFAMGRAIHAELDRLGLTANPGVENALIHMYAKCGSMAAARRVFDSMDRARRTVASWTSIALGYIDDGKEIQALDMLQRMRDDGCALDSQSFVVAIKACSNLSARDRDMALGIGRDFHDRATRFGFDSDVYLCNVLISLYSKCGRMDEACRVFAGLGHPNVVAWTSLIAGYIHNGENEVAIYCFSLMHCDGCLPDAHAFAAVLRAFGCLAAGKGGEDNSRLFRLFRSVCCQAQGSGYDSDVFVASAMVELYAKFGDMVAARRVFDGMARRDVVCWTTMILAQVENERAEEALELFSRMQANGECVADAKVFVAAIMACARLATREHFQRVDGKLVKLRALEKGMDVHSQATKQGFDTRDVFVGSSLLDLYAKCGSLVDARRVFNRMKLRDVVMWTALALAYVDNGEADTGLETFRRMRLEGCLLDAQAFVAGLKACTCLAALQMGRSLHRQVCASGLENDELVLSSLVDFYSKCGRMSEARSVFDRLGSKTGDTVIWTTMIAGYSRQGSTDKAIELFTTMQDRGLRPDAITFTFVLAACSHAGLVDRGKEYFELMSSKFGIRPDVEHYHGMIDLLGRANRVEEAVSVARSMPYRQTVVTWMTVLAACEKWKDVRLGRVAFDSLVALDERQCSAYISMANIYGSLGMVEEESRMLEMRNKLLAGKDRTLTR